MQAPQHTPQKNKRLWLKAILYRIVRIGIVFISGFFILGDPSSALRIAGIDTIAATLFYFYFDKFWEVINAKITYVTLKWKYRKLDE